MENRYFCRQLQAKNYQVLAATGYDHTEPRQPYTLQVEVCCKLNDLAATMHMVGVYHFKKRSDAFAHLCQLEDEAELIMTIVDNLPYAQHKVKPLNDWFRIIYAEGQQLLVRKVEETKIAVHFYNQRKLEYDLRSESRRDVIFNDLEQNIFLELDCEAALAEVTTVGTVERR